MLTSLAAHQQRLRGVILDHAPAEPDLLELGAEAWRWLTYRRLVRNRLYETIDHGFGRLIEQIGLERFRGMVDRFLAERASRSPYLRDVPGEFLAWLERRAATAPEAHELPGYGLDLARLEWAELAAAYEPDVVPDRPITDFAMDRPAALSPAHRQLWLTHPVHRLGAEDGGADPSVQKPTVLCVYRDRSSFDVHTLELTPVTGALLREIARTDRPLVDVIRSVASEFGATLDGAFLHALSGVLADFLERGLILGSLAEAPAVPQAPGVLSGERG